MNRELIFRICVDISSYPYEIFILRDFTICSISFVIVHLRFISGYGLLKACSIK